MSRADGDDATTRRENPPASGTRREQAPASGTRREQAPASGTRREQAPSNGTRREGSDDPRVPADLPRRRLLPEPLAERFIYHGDLPHGSQADVTLCRDRQSGDLVVIKLYRFDSSRLDREALAKVGTAASAHVVRTIETGVTADEPWEIQEYCHLGSFMNMRTRAGGQLSTTVVTSATAELCEALAHLHGLSVVHRDIKPQNVLVRSEKPLDLVLADFGLATELVLTRDIRSVAGTWAYSAPESMHGSLSYAADWWSLGVMLHEALTGRHLFAKPDGRMLDDPQIRAALVEGSYQISGVLSARMRELLDGLLTHSWRHRWNQEQVREWLAGGHPEVWRESGAAPEPPVARRLGYTFAGTVCRTPEELASAMRAHWSEAGDLVAGRVDADLTAWLAQFPCAGAATAALQSGRPPGATLVALQKVLDPDADAEFRGTALTTRGISERINAARSGSEPAVDWVTALRQERVLGAYAAATGSAKFAEADRRLATWNARLETLVATLPAAHRTEATTALRPAVPDLVAAALGDDGGLVARSRRVVAGSTNPGWAAPVIAAARTADDDDLAVHALALALVPFVAQQQRDETVRSAAEAEAAKRAAAERAAEEAQRNRQRIATERRRAWRASVRGRLAWRSVFSVGYALLGSFAVGSGHYVEANGVWHTAGPIALSALASVLVVELVEYSTGRRPLAARWALVAIGLVAGAGPVVESIAVGYVGQSELLRWPWWLAGAWALRLVAGWLIDVKARRTMESVQSAGRWAPYRGLAGVLSTIGVATAAAAFVALRVEPSVIAYPYEMIRGLGDWPSEAYRWLTSTLPDFDPLGLRTDPGKIPALGGTALLLVAGNRDLRRLSPVVAGIGLALACVASVLVFLAMPWGVVVLVAGVGSALLGVLVVVGLIAVLITGLSS